MMSRKRRAPRASGRILRSQLVPLALRHLRARGIDTAGMVPASIDAEASRGEVRIELGALRAFLEECCRRTSNPWFGVELAEARPVGSLGLVEFFWRSSATVREGLATVAAHSRLLNDLARLELVVAPGHASFVERVDVSPVGLGRVANEFFAVTCVREMRSLVSGSFAPTGASFAHARPAGTLDRLQRALGTRAIRWGQSATGVDFALRWLDAPLATADASLAGTLRSHVANWLPWVDQPASAAFQSRLAAALHASVGRSLTLGRTARELGVSARTLQRRLSEAGVTFQSVADEVMREHATRLLDAGRLGAKEIASRLGYGSPAAFTRAFRRWTGTTPGAWRDRETKRRDR